MSSTAAPVPLVSHSRAVAVLLVGPAADTHEVGDQLRGEGIPVEAVPSGLDALVRLGALAPPVVVVSCGVEDVAAPDLVAAIRRNGDTLIFAVVDADDAALAGRVVLAGASGLLTRPFTAGSVLAAVERTDPDLLRHDRATYGPISLDLDAYTVSVSGRRLADPPAKEFELLRVLLRRAPELVTDDELRSSVWGADTAPADNTIAVHAARLRHRLEGVATIRRVRGRGYVLTLA
ncbi:winged helix-turn-helix transcriptional regulator [Nocardioides sp. SYSU DS0663]|uniref:winged helix-turn-helix transcriptional regulator n=1 Tax=Nocardioides sp. SYSU DS0663 TaxID=3416445 RepID=UPI003F4B6BC5